LLNFVVPADTVLSFSGLNEISLDVVEGEPEGGTSTISAEVGIFLLLLLSTCVLKCDDEELCINHYFRINRSSSIFLQDVSKTTLYGVINRYYLI